MCVASNIGHSAGEIYELAEAADEVDGNKGILGRNHTSEQESVLSWGTAPSSMAARRQPKSLDSPSKMKEGWRSHPGWWE